MTVNDLIEKLEDISARGLGTNKVEIFDVYTDDWVEVDKLYVSPTTGVVSLLSRLEEY